jgi:putative FmdB family regulatory protein
MPLYEYRCQACGESSTLLVLKNSTQELICTQCGSGELRRLMSGFAVHKTEATRLKELDTKRRPDGSFYHDDRNIGLWAKKRTRELGVDLGDSLDEKIEKARTSKLDDIISN